MSRYSLDDLIDDINFAKEENYRKKGSYDVHEVRITSYGIKSLIVEIRNITNTPLSIDNLTVLGVPVIEDDTVDMWEIIL